MPEETRAKASASHMGQVAWNKGLSQTEEAKERLRELGKERW